MTLLVAIQMDPIESINPKSDSTLQLALEAQARGFTLWYYTPDKLSWREGDVVATAHRLTVKDSETDYFALGQPQTIRLRDMNVVLLRQDPPFNMAYIGTTYLLEHLPEKTRVVNNPASVRDWPEKWMPVLFQEFMPPTLISADADIIEQFIAMHKDVVVKPFYGFGGGGIFRLSVADKDAHERVLAALATEKNPLVVQKFLPEVKEHDKRIVLINGEVAGVFGRIPAEGEIRANMRVGGTPVKAELTPREKEICRAVGPVLKEKGLVFVGLDVIGDWLTEINITSPTGLATLKDLYGINASAKFWDVVEKNSA